MILTLCQMIQITRRLLTSTSVWGWRSLRPRQKLGENSCSLHSSRKLIAKGRSLISSTLSLLSPCIRMAKFPITKYLEIAQHQRMQTSPKLNGMQVSMTSTIICAEATSRSIVSTSACVWSRMYFKGFIFNYIYHNLFTILVLLNL